MLLSDLKESWFGRKEVPKASSPLTPEERSLIKRLFPDSNVDLKHGTSQHLFDRNAHAVYKNLRLSFYKRGDELRVSVGHYRDDMGPGNPSVSPVTHTDHQATEDELERVQRLAR
jgi:hypothetical protein